VLLSRKTFPQKPPYDYQASVTAFILLSFFVFLSPKTAHPIDVTVAWSPNTETDLGGYRIYHREEGQAYDYDQPLWEGIDTTCTIYNLDDTTNHYFVARAFDVFSNESQDSAEVSLEASADTDGDGIPDGFDSCPNDPNKSEPGICGCGVPDTDSDGDGIANCNDGCPNDPAKALPGICGCSQVDKDTDGDGTLDCNDSCPSNPNKTEPDIWGCSDTDKLTPPPDWNIEVGEVIVDDGWTWVKYNQPFEDPIVVAKLMTLNDWDPSVVRIADVQNEGFKVHVQEWEYLDGPHTEEAVSYLVIERGSYQLSDGTRVEAGSFYTSSTRSFDNVVFNQVFDKTPVVVISVSTFNGPDPLTGRIKSISTKGFKFRMQEEESKRQKHIGEIIAYIAWEPASGTTQGITFEVNRTERTVTHDLHTILFDQSFMNIPVVLANMQTCKGNNTANVRCDNADFDGIHVLIDEEQSLDDELWHVPEVVGYMAFSVED